MYPAENYKHHILARIYIHKKNGENKDIYLIKDTCITERKKRYSISLMLFVVYLVLFVVLYSNLVNLLVMLCLLLMNLNE